jgi:Aldehyde dehydrogenase family/short chain dehydrogenase
MRGSWMREEATTVTEAKVAFITGAARGQGRAHAVKLASAGMNIIGLDIRADIRSMDYANATADDLRTTAKLVEAAGGQVVAEKGDVRSYDDLRRVLALGLDRFGRVDVLLANAGIVRLSPDGDRDQTWTGTSTPQRRDVLMRFAGLLDEHRAEFAALQALDGGTPTRFGHRIIDNSVNWTRYYAGWCGKLSGELISTLDTRGCFSCTAPEAYGVIGAIVTWNGPVVSLGMKLVPALAAGIDEFLRYKTVSIIEPQ